MSNIHYRPDIDGLRAVAILTVVLYHAQLGFGGGFVGVDVFFVISGFLISSIIVKETAGRSFSYWNFYKRRALRILPALFTMLAGCYIAGWFLLLPMEYRRFADSAMAAAAFYPNFYFLNNSDYFAPDAFTQPLLHTWSLGVEEQFYFLAPILLILGVRFARLRTPLFVAIFLASLAWSQWLLAKDASQAFYMLPPRAFELMVGTALALKLVPAIRSRAIAEVTGLTGLAMVLAAALLYTEDTSFPGLNALLPCIGAALLIHSATNVATTAARALSFKPVVFIGKISYSLYLWHWPVLVFAFLKFGLDLELHVRVGLVLLAVLLAVLSYYLVEQPIRLGGSGLRAGPVVTVSLAAILFWLPVTLYVRAAQGIPERLPEQAAAFFDANASGRVNNDGLCRDGDSERLPRGSDCDIGADVKTPEFLFVGDSHAQAIANTVAAVAKDLGIAGHAVMKSGCPPVLGLTQEEMETYGGCLDVNAAFEKSLATPGLNLVIIAGRWAPYAEGTMMPNERSKKPRIFAETVEQSNAIFRAKFLEMVKSIAASGRKVVIFGPVPELGYDAPTEIARALIENRPLKQELSRQAFEERQANMLSILAEASRLDNVTVLYPHEILCDAEICRSNADRKVAYYLDDDHLSSGGATLIEPLIRAALKQASGLSGLPQTSLPTQ